MSAAVKVLLTLAIANDVSRVTGALVPMSAMPLTPDQVGAIGQDDRDGDARDAVTLPETVESSLQRETCLRRETRARDRHGRSDDRRIAGLRPWARRDDGCRARLRRRGDGRQSIDASWLTRGGGRRRAGARHGVAAAAGEVPRTRPR